MTDAANERIAKLEAQKRQLTDLNAKKQARIAELEAALKPFAELNQAATCWRDKPDDYPAWALDVAMLLVGDFRRAAEVAKEK